MSGVASDGYEMVVFALWPPASKRCKYTLWYLPLSGDSAVSYQAMMLHVIADVDRGTSAIPLLSCGIGFTYYGEVFRGDRISRLSYYQEREGASET